MHYVQTFGYLKCWQKDLGLLGGMSIFGASVEDIALTDSLFKIEIPTLILWGKYDFVVPPALGYDA